VFRVWTLFAKLDMQWCSANLHHFGCTHIHIEASKSTCKAQFRTRSHCSALWSHIKLICLCECLTNCFRFTVRCRSMHQMFSCWWHCSSVGRRQFSDMAVSDKLPVVHQIAWFVTWHGTMDDSDGFDSWHAALLEAAGEVPVRCGPIDEWQLATLLRHFGLTLGITSAYQKCHRTVCCRRPGDWWWKPGALFLQRADMRIRWPAAEVVGAGSSHYGMLWQFDGDWWLSITTPRCWTWMVWHINSVNPGKQLLRI